MSQATTRAVVMQRANPVISALMMLSLAVYVACCAITVLAALAGHETRRAPLMTGAPREIEIGPQRVEIERRAAIVGVPDSRAGSGLAYWSVGL